MDPVPRMQFRHLAKYDSEQIPRACSTNSVWWYLSTCELLHWIDLICKIIDTWIIFCFCFLLQGHKFRKIFLIAFTATLFLLCFIILCV